MMTEEDRGGIILTLLFWALLLSLGFVLAKVNRDFEALTQRVQTIERKLSK